MFSILSWAIRFLLNSQFINHSMQPMHLIKRSLIDEDTKYSIKYVEINSSAFVNFETTIKYF
jgi:hypothetical protein